jgi:FixJ family two-component response regulator
MALITAGRMNKRAAWELGLSEVTIRIHHRSAMQKTGAKSLTDLVRIAELLRRP